MILPSGPEFLGRGDLVEAGEGQRRHEGVLAIGDISCERSPIPLALGNGGLYLRVTPLSMTDEKQTPENSTVMALGPPPAPRRWGVLGALILMALAAGIGAAALSRVAFSRLPKSALMRIHSLRLAWIACILLVVFVALLGHHLWRVGHFSWVVQPASSSQHVAPLVSLGIQAIAWCLAVVALSSLVYPSLPATNPPRFQSQRTLWLVCALLFVTAAALIGLLLRMADLAQLAELWEWEDRHVASVGGSLAGVLAGFVLAARQGRRREMEQRQQQDRPEPRAVTGGCANLPLAVVGAAAGGLVWFAIQFVVAYPLELLAVLPAATAGFGAVALGKGHGCRVGLVATAFGLFGVVGGGYGSLVVHKAQEHEELLIYRSGRLATLTAEERNAVLAPSRANIDEMTLASYMMGSGRRSAVLILFGIAGLLYGFKLGTRGLAHGPSSLGGGSRTERTAPR